MERLTPARLRKHIDAGGRVVDVREPSMFADRHVRGALNIALSNRGAPMWAQRLLGEDDRVAIVTATDRENSVAEQLLAMAGRRAGGFAPFDEKAFADAGITLAAIRTLVPPQLAQERDRLTVVDVREEQEYLAGHVPGAVWIPLGELAQRAGEVPAGPVATICASGFRSSSAASILERAGRDALANVWGGTTAWMQLGFPMNRGRNP